MHRYSADQLLRGLPHQKPQPALRPHDSAPGDYYGSSAEMQWLNASLGAASAVQVTPSASGSGRVVVEYSTAET